VALLHDLVLTVGIYALVGFTVTPATLIGVLTILGYSLYDTVVVFDKVRENVRDIKSSTNKTYSEAANLAVNQVLVRSINTTIIGVLPVAALLFAGAVILGEGPLKDLALALFVGMISGAYSSIFIATPMLAQLKEREPDMQKLASRVASRRQKEAAKLGLQGTGPSVPVGRQVSSDSALAHPADSAHAGRSNSEPSNEELAAAALASGAVQPEIGGSRSGTRITVSSASAGPSVPAKPLSDGAAKRPQPQHKPRSQRKK
jgi:preprotein translocase subunit SecF